MSETSKPLGFWSCWSLTVGCMIGSGVFLLPSVLAPYGLLSFGGWLVTGAGSILVALTLARLAARTTRTGGPYAFVHDAFGDLLGFANVWGYWASYWTGIAAVAVAFAGYLTVFIPALNDNPVGQALSALALIWTLTLINIRGLRESSILQLALTVLKIAPLLAVIALGVFAGRPEYLPAFNPQGAPILPAIAATALLTMWAFVGLEAGTIPASACKDAARIIPRAVVIGTLTVAAIYLAATAAVMSLVPANVLAESTSPFAEAARAFGAWGPWIIAAGALLSTAGAANGLIFCGAQLPMAAALDRLAPRILGVTDKGGAPFVSLLLTSAIASVLLVTNYSRGLIGAFTFLIILSTLGTLLPYLLCAIAELRQSWRSARGWAGVALLAGLYSIFAILGSGAEALVWGAVLFGSGVPIYFLVRQKTTAALTRPS
ncbi:MAG TPA: amino acid permease [Candidatus Binatia bacterium]|nr:amino acid permease [Candidatus Binatia bacterium]